MPMIFSRALVALALLAPALVSADVFINEIHYDDSDTPTTGDNNEGVEIVATAGENLSLYDIVLYNGSAPAAAVTYDTDPVPAGSIVACGANVRIGVVAYAGTGASQLQNGANDAIALVRRSDSAVIQFLSYEGAATASNGPASGQTSANIPVSESNSTAEGSSLQLGGNATTYAGFTWNGSATATSGTCNNSQTFGTAVDNPPTVASSVPSHTAIDVPVGTPFSITFSEQVDVLSSAWFTFSCGAGTPTLTASAGPATTFTLTPSGPLGYSKLCNLTVLASQVRDRDGTANLMQFNDTIQFATVVDNRPEVVPPTTPIDLASDVARAANLSVTFSEPVTAPAAAFAIQCPVGSTREFAISSDDDTVFVLDPTLDLPASTACRLSVDNLQVTDRDGTFDNPDRNTEVNFTTAALAAPTVVSTVPAKDATNFPPAGDLQVVFDASVTLTPGAFTLSCTLSTGIVLTHANSGTTFVIGTSTVLVEGDSCTLSIEADAVTSGDGLNPVADEVVNFTVASTSTATYWQNVNLSSPAQLRCSVHQTIRNHTVGSYTLAWEVLEAGEEDPANPARVLDAYRNCSYLAGASGNRVGGSGGGATCSGDPDELYNREHTWPNSLGFGNSGLAAYTDTHMLYATDEGYNASRGNKPYANCPSGCTEEPTSVNNGVGGGTGVYPGNSNWYDGSSYEVWNHRKGDMARAVMYMAIRYEGGDSVPDLELTDTRALIVGTASSAPTAYMGLLTTVLQWNQFDLPDQRELDRNAIVQTYQGNRNPFIDHPEWATAGLFGSVQPAMCVLNTNAPAANDDSYATPINTTLLVAANAGVLSNDTDAESAPLSAQLVSGVASGTLALAANGGFTYTPAAGFCGSTSFSYRASDGVRLSATRLATIAVGTGCVGNQPPVANDAIFALPENSAAATVVGSVVASDPDAGTALGYSITAGNGSGAFAISASGQMTVVNVAPLNFEITPQFVLTVTVTDNAAPIAATDTASITINLVNVEEGAAQAAADGANAIEDAGQIAIPVLANDTPDPDGGGFDVNGVDDPANGSARFTTTSVNYTPDPQFCGIDSFGYTISGSISATITVIVACVNDAPTAVGSLSARSAQEGVAITSFSVAGGFNDIDAGDDLDYSQTGLPAGLTLDVASGTVSGTPSIGSATGSVYTVTITATDGEALTLPQQSFQYTVTPVAPSEPHIFGSGFEG